MAERDTGLGENESEGKERGRVGEGKWERRRGEIAERGRMGREGEAQDGVGEGGGGAGVGGVGEGEVG